MTDGRLWKQRIGLKFLCFNPTIVYQGNEIPMYYSPYDNNVVVPKNILALYSTPAVAKNPIISIIIGDGRRTVKNLPFDYVYKMGTCTNMGYRLLIENFYSNPAKFCKSIIEFCDKAVNFLQYYAEVCEGIRTDEPDRYNRIFNTLDEKRGYFARDYNTLCVYAKEIISGKFTMDESVDAGIQARIMIVRVYKCIMKYNYIMEQDDVKNACKALYKEIARIKER